MAASISYAPAIQRAIDLISNMEQGKGGVDIPQSYLAFPPTFQYLIQLSMESQNSISLKEAHRTIVEIPKASGEELQRVERVFCKALKECVSRFTKSRENCDELYRFLEVIDDEADRDTILQKYEGLSLWSQKAVAVGMFSWICSPEKSLNTSDDFVRWAKSACKRVPKEKLYLSSKDSPLRLAMNEIISFYRQRNR